MRRIFEKRLKSCTSHVESALEDISAWKSACFRDHQECRQSWKLVSPERQLPTRLLYISDRDSKLHVALTYTTNLSQDTEYVTLSHCWGSMQYSTLSTLSELEFLNNIPLEQLSQTFRDAIHVTSRLGYSYLWIDTLCIVQDSPEDWLHESSLMDRVYAHSALNIAATAAANGAGGLFYESSYLAKQTCLVSGPQRNPYGSAWARGRVNLLFQTTSELLWGEQIEHTPLGSRGWVVQERLLSPRTVHFTKTGALWECCLGQATPSIAEDKWLHHQSNIKHLNTEKALPHQRATLFDQWNTIVAKYTECKLTYPSDKLIAISGLARRHCRQMDVDPSSYLAGLWKETLPQGLLWYSLQHKKTNTLTAPSWSWAHVDGPVENVRMNLLNPMRQDYRATTFAYTIDVSITMDINHTDPFGPVSGGVIRLEGPLLSFDALKTISDYVKDKPQYADLPPLADSVIWDAETLPADLQRCWFILVEAVDQQSERVWLAILAVLPTGLKRGQYRRVGIICYLTCAPRQLEMMKRVGRDEDGVPEEFQQGKTERGWVAEII